MPIIKDENGNKIPGGHTNTVWKKVDDVVLMILNNLQYLEAKRNKELVTNVTKKFKVSFRMAQIYVSEAKKEIRRLGKSNKEKSFLKALYRLEFLWEAAKRKQDYKLALQVLQERSKILDLYPPAQTKYSGELTIKNVDMSKLTEYGLERLKRGDSVDEVMIDPRSIKQDYSLN